jgi:hypothetical protein
MNTSPSFSFFRCLARCRRVDFFLPDFLLVWGFGAARRGHQWQYDRSSPSILFHAVRSFTWLLASGSRAALVPGRLATVFRL